MPRSRNIFPDFSRQKKGLQQLAIEFTKVAGTVAVNHFKDNFRKGGFLDGGLERWKPRKDADNVRNKGRAILTQSGDLRRSIRVLSLSRNSVTVGSDVIYAEIHNNGGNISHPGGTPYITVRDKATKEKKVAFISNRRAASLPNVKRTKAHTIPMPQRQFIGHSKILDERIKKWLKSQVMALLK